MSRNESLIDAPLEAVFDVLQDGRRYADWVVGASRIRKVDPQFPEPGTSFGHKLGVWPLLFNDEAEDDPPRGPATPSSLHLLKRIAEGPSRVRRTEPTGEPE